MTETKTDLTMNGLKMRVRDYGDNFATIFIDPEEFGQLGPISVAYESHTGGIQISGSVGALEAVAVALQQHLKARHVEVVA